MAKSPTVLIYITLAILLVLFLSSSHRPHSRHRRLKLRPPPPHPDHHHRPPIPFDPVISSIERKLDDRQYERAHFMDAPGHEAQPGWEYLADADDYINDEERFNVTGRIELLFPKLDVAPADGYVSADELAEWNYQMGFREIMHRTARDMEAHDRDRDGFISLGEYEVPSWPRRSDEGST